MGYRIYKNQFLWWCFFLFVFFVVPAALAASEQKGGAVPQEGEQSGWERFCDFVVGQPAQDTIYLGMWSHHFIDNDDDYRTTHNLLA